MSVELERADGDVFDDVVGDLYPLDQLTSLVVFNAMFYYMLGMFAVIRLRRKYPDIQRPYRVVGYPVVPILIGIVFFGLLINTLVEDPATAQQIRESPRLIPQR